MPPAPSRIAVVGCGGSGKSTLSRRLGAALGRPVVHLDAEFWRPGWVESPKDEWHARHAELVAPDSWLIDGNYGGTFPLRFARADAVVVVDLPRWRCLLGITRRSLRWLGRTRPDMAPGCPERLPTRDFARWVWRYPTDSRPRLEAALAEHAGDAEVVWLRRRRDAERLVERWAVASAP